MKVYHIIWWKDSEEKMSTGKDYHALNMVEAIMMFIEENGDINPINVVDKKLLNK